jgi:tetratricopeptide (TPR) repeat protein
MGFHSKILFLIVFCLFAFSIASGDVIYLKNGKKIECDSALDEGNVIKYKIASGTASLPKSIVDRIEKKAIPPLPTPEQPPGEPDPLTQERLARFYTDRGMEYLSKKDFYKAQQQFRKAYSFKDNETTAFNLAVAYYYLKDDENAETFFRETLAKNQDNTPALNYLAELYWRKEELDEAAVYWRKSLSVKDDPAIREKLKKLDQEQQTSASFQSEQSDHFVIRYDGGSADPAFASKISTFLEEAYERLSSQYDLRPADPFVVILYPQQQFDGILDVPVWSGGTNDGKIKLAIKGLSDVNEELKKKLLHELSHSFVSLKSSQNSPGWLQEGLAKYMEGDRTSAQGRTILRNLLSTRSLPPLRNLEGSFARANTQTASIFYVESLSFVEYLINRYSFFQINQLLDGLGDQQSLRDAFESAFLVPMDDMETRWRSDVALSR